MTRRYLSPTPGPAAEIAAMFSELVPHLQTERTRLRAPRLSDFDAYTEIACTERGTHIDGPSSQEDAWFDFLSLSSGWMLHGHGGWAVEENATGALLGFVILGLEPGDHDIELGFLFREAAEGKGFAFEAASAVRDWAFEHLELPALDSYIDERNTRSIALAKRLGAMDETPQDWAGTGAKRYRHRATETLT